MIELRVLGPTVVRTADHDVYSLLAQPKRLAVLAWIAIAGRDGLVRRESLMAMFWPELDEERARAAVRQTLHLTRQSLGAEALTTVGTEEVGVAPALWCDAVALERAVAAGRHEDALALYRGELLAGLHLDDVPDFERWLDRERERLRQLAAAAARGFSARAEAEGRLTDAITACSRALEIDPLGEAGLRRLLTLLVQAGERARALRTFEEWRTQVARDVGVEPSQETRALVEQLRADPVLPPALSARAAATSDAQARHSMHAHPDVPAAVTDPVASALRHRPRRRWPAALAAVIVVMAVAIAFALDSRGDELVDVAAHRVLVLAFDNRTGDATLDPIGGMASDWIVQGLAHTELVEVVSASDMVAAANVAEFERDTRATPLTIARAAGAAFVVSGAYYRQGARLHFQAHVNDADGNIITVLDPVASSADDPLGALETLRERAMTALAPYVHPRLRTWAPAMAKPPDYDAYLAFVQGVSLHNQSRWREAIEHHARAAAIAPNFVQAQVWAAKSYMNLNDYRAADSIARIVAPRRSQLNFMDRLMLEWIEATVRGDNNARLAYVRELHRRLPRAELVTYQLGRELISTNQPAAAVEVLERIDPDAGFMVGWRQYWIEYTAALHLTSEHARELKAARQAWLRFPGTIRVLALEAIALAALGDTAALRRVTHDIVAAQPDGSTRPSAVLMQVTMELRAHGHNAAAARTAALALHESDAGTIQAHSEDYGEALLLAGRVREARELQQHRVAQDSTSVNAWTVLGVAAALSGDDVTARAADTRIAALAGEALPGRARFARARIAAALGSADAQALFRRAAAEGMPHGLITHAETHWRRIAK